MKTKVLLLALLTATVLSSCKKDSESLTSAETLLLGTWEMTAMTYTGTSSSTTQGFTTVTNFDGVAKDITYEVEFLEDPKTYETAGGYTVELTSVVEDFVLYGELFEGYTIVTDSVIEDFMSTGSWSSDGNTVNGLAFDNGQPADPNASYEIEELSESTFRIIFNSATTYSPEPGVSTSADVQGEVVFEKL